PWLGVCAGEGSGGLVGVVGGGGVAGKCGENVLFSLKQHGDEEVILKSFRDINELIKDTLETKSKYVNVETELNEIHERYSQLSLQFADVEGERQKIMITLKNVRSPRTLAHINFSSSGTLENNLLLSPD
nr:hypothetical protein [Tanacetum cinerariifolium]